MTTFATSSLGGLDDAALARAAAAGDRSAFAAIYDRYADRLHDFCIGMLRDREAAADCVQDVFVTAATKLVQLREPDRLRSWLYAIARSEALARIRARKREQLSEEVPEMPSGEADMATLAARTELADLIADASGGLSDRDRVVLELAYRQGLDGPELAEALGVTPKNANTLVERLRETVARSLGALLLCRRIKADPNRCPELAAIVDQWDGQLTPLLRKRVARHVDGCAICDDDRARMVSPAALLGAAPMVIPAPAWLRSQTLDRAVLTPPGQGAKSTGPKDDGSWWPPKDFDGDGADANRAATPGKAARRRGLVGLGAALVLLGVGGAAVLGAPAAFRVVPADDSGPVPPAATSTQVTTTSTTPSIAQRIAPSDGPTTVPPAEATTTAIVIAPTTTTDGPSPVQAPRTTEPEPSTTAPSTTRPRPTTKRTEPSEEEPPSLPWPNTDQSSDEPSTPDTPPSKTPPTKTPPPKTKPPVTISKAPPADVGPSCPVSDPQCNGGGGPVFN